MAARPAGRRPKRSAGSEEPRAAPEADQTAALKAEMERLRAELDAARDAIASLEQARDQALDRIAWITDSLHNLIGE